MPASVFYACKAIAYGGQQSEYLLHLVRVLMRMGQFGLATELLHLNGLENGVIYFLADEDLTQLHYRFGSLESMQPLSDTCVILPSQIDSKGKVRVEIQDLNSFGTHILYPDGWGPYSITRINGKLMVQKMKHISNNSFRDSAADELIFGDYKMPMSIKWIRGLTPFQFSQNQPN